MTLLTVDNICKSYDEKPLLTDITFTIDEKEKIGLIGINGAGKSTLLQIIAGITQQDSGNIIKANGTVIAYLAQNPLFHSGTTVLDQVFLGIDAATRLEREYEGKTILNKLGIEDFDKDVALLSGGQRKRVALAAVLINPVDLLLLDEPTNHIDSSMAAWLENYLSAYPGAVLMITHDRYFLDKIVNRIVEIGKGELYQYPGNYSQFVTYKAEREEMDVATIRKKQSLFRKELSWMQRGARARSTKSRSRIERFENLKDDLVQVEDSKMAMISSTTRLGKKTIEVKNISKAFGDQVLLKNWDYIVNADDRIGIIGPNGIGKSTLLKMLAGVLPPDSGSIEWGETVKIGYFTQEYDDLDTSLRVLEYIRSAGEEAQTNEGSFSATQLLERFMFSSDVHWTPIEKLSGGERRRLYLLHVLMSAPNILLLDEPTNDLDIMTLNILEDYLQSFTGAVLTVSHDRYFMDKIANRIFAFGENGILQQYEGNYSDYLSKVATEEKDSKQLEKADLKQDIPKMRTLKFTFKEKQEFAVIDQEIADLEAEISRTEQQLTTAGSDYQLLSELLATKDRLNVDLEAKMERWVYLNDLAEQIENQKS